MRGLEIRAGKVRYGQDLPAPAPPEPLGAPVGSAEPLPPSEASARAGGETRVRVLSAGVCATDLALARGYMNFEGVPGHEFVGIALDGPLAGRRVVGDINAACGRCPTCLAGQEHHCPHRTVLGILGRSGAFAEELSLPTRNLFTVPSDVTTDQAVFAEPLAAAFEIPAQLDLRDLDRAIVLGDGRLGLLCAQVLSSAGLAVTLYGRHPDRAPFAGARTTHGGLPPGEPPPHGDRAPLVVEATGDPAVLSLALRLAAPRGTVVLKTTSERPAPLDLAPLVVDEITLLGSRCGPFDAALAALAAGEVSVEPLIVDRFSLEDGPKAFARAARPGTLKVLIDVSSE